MAERDKNGRFVKGHAGGPGRPPREREEKYYELAMTSVTYKDWQAIINRAANDAKRGDAQARKWLAEYLAPKIERHDITSKGERLNDGQEVNRSISTLADALGEIVSTKDRERDSDMDATE
jgi:hypothetical protein